MLFPAFGFIHLPRFTAETAGSAILRPPSFKVHTQIRRGMGVYPRLPLVGENLLSSGLRLTLLTSNPITRMMALFFT